MEGIRQFFMNRRDLMTQFFLVVLLWVIAGVSVGVVGTLVMGCSCRNLMPQIVKTQNMVVDAQTSLVQAKAMFQALEDENIKLPADVQAKLDKAMADGEQGLRTALAVLDHAMNICDEIDQIAAFDDFNKAWKIIRELLPFATKGAARMGITPVEGQPLIPDPVAYKMSFAQ